MIVSIFANSQCAAEAEAEIAHAIVHCALRHDTAAMSSTWHHMALPSTMSISVICDNYVYAHRATNPQSAPKLLTEHATYVHVAVPAVI